MNLDAIAVFIKVVQCGSFTQAARFLKMPVSTVSTKVSQLENKLGITLIRRTTRKLQVTEAGEAYFKSCAQALETIQTAEIALSVNKKEPQGLLKLTAPEDIGNSLLPFIIQKFLEKYQFMNVELFITNHLIDLMGEGVDLAIRAGDLKDSSLIAKKFMTEPLFLWASPIYLKKTNIPLHPEELNSHEFILYKFLKEKTIKLTRNNQKVLITPKGRVSLSSSQAAKILALLGQGIGLFPQFLCDADVKKGKLVKILPQWSWHNLPYFFVYPAQRFISSKIKAFIAFAEEYLETTKTY